ncbi:MAG: hypothetical protein CSA47_00635 [Gammaproteobacteria bacterium]|nr:MAG: hypothetical protein CSA47_00635 [Gammaproteobacteria bacterium]
MDIHPISDLNDRDPQRLINFYHSLPCTANSGAKILSISEGLDHIVMKIPFNEQTKNFMGITYGGAMYSATDAVYVTMLWYRLGYDYLVIDKSSTVKYLRPGTEDLTVEFHLPESEINAIKAELKSKKSTSRNYPINIVNGKGKAVCKITKEIVIRNNRRK